MNNESIVWKNIELITQNVKAFVYVITINKNGEDKWYIGYKTIKRGWMDYISSSKYVKEDKEFITSKVILEVFDNKQDAIAREELMINQLDAVKSDKYYNRQNSGKTFNTIGLPPSKLAIDGPTQRLSNLRLDPAFVEKQKKTATQTLANLKLDPNFKAKSRAASVRNMARIKSDPDIVIKSRNAAKQNLTNLNKDPVFKAKKIAACSKAIKILNSNPEFTLKRNEATVLANSKKVQNLDNMTIYSSVTIAAKELGTTRATICKHCKGKVDNPKWQYV